MSRKFDRRKINGDTVSVEDMRTAAGRIRVYYFSREVKKGTRSFVLAYNVTIYKDTKRVRGCVWRKRGAVVRTARAMGRVEIHTSMGSGASYAKSYETMVLALDAVRNI